MNISTIVDMWDNLIETAESKRQQENTNTSDPRCHPLRPSENFGSKLEPGIHRDISRIDPKLRLTIRTLIAGKAFWPLFLHGGAGTGKTCAALSVLDFAKSGSYLTQPELFHKARLASLGQLTFHANGRTNPVSEDAFWNTFLHEHLTILDDIGGRDEINDFRYESIKKLLDLRTNKPLIVTSNLSIADLAKIFDDRITSRLAAGTVFKLTGPDQRISHHSKPSEKALDSSRPSPRQKP